MRWFAVALLCVGCQFSVVGSPAGASGGDPATGGGAGGGGGSVSTPPPTGGQTTPPPASSTDLALPPTTGGADMALPGEPVGGPCMMDNQCQAGLTCAHSFVDGGKKIDVPGGYCTRACSATAPCPAGSVCAQLSVGSYCQDPCPPDPCRMGYTCCDTGGGQNSCTASMLCS